MTVPAGLSPPLEEAVRAVRARTAFAAEVALILGTGMGALAEAMDVEAEVPYAAILGFPVATVESHAGRLLCGRLGGRAVVAMQGRFHLYEGYRAADLALPVRVLGLLGADTLVVCNAAGGLHPLWGPGDLVVLDDHLNLLGDNPLIGANENALGPRFPDMSEPYDRALQALAETVALEAGIPLRRGVYAAVAGPNLETRAEYRMLRRLGADLVGMSTVPEVITARHMGLRVLGLSIVTDACLPDALEPTDIDTIIRVAAGAEPHLARLVQGVLRRLPDVQRAES